ADAALMDALPKVRIIASNSVGVDAIDLAAAKARGIVVSNTPGVLNECVADLGMALTLAISRRLVEADRYVRSGQWPKGAFAFGTKLGGKTMGIVGMGRIGQQVAQRAAAFGMTIVYHSRHKKPDIAYRYYDDLAAMAAASDFLLLILQDGVIAGAALDVFADEPRAPEALFAMDNVILQPHQASATHETRTAMGQLMIDNLKAHFAGKPLLTPVG